ncbi:hypothetical protein ACISSW_28715, partial [Escherichia coli]
GAATPNAGGRTGAGPPREGGAAVWADARGQPGGRRDGRLGLGGDITLDAFTGTTGSLMLTAAGAVINTALLYAGNNLSLFASTIRNHHGDMLAGDSTGIQKNVHWAAHS